MGGAYDLAQLYSEIARHRIEDRSLTTEYYEDRIFTFRRLNPEFVLFPAENSFVCFTFPQCAGMGLAS
jgi:hypothetical protein